MPNLTAYEGVQLSVEIGSADGRIIAGKKGEIRSDKMKKSLIIRKDDQALFTA